MITFYNLSAIFVGGGLGAVLRYSVSLLTALISSRVWLGTLIVNVIGSMVIILLSKVITPSSDVLKLFLKVGLLGGLTTFSSFSLEVFSLYSQGLLFESILVVIFNIVFGVIVGIWIFA